VDADVFVPLAVFAVVVLAVAIAALTKLRDTEMQVHQRLYMEELEHQRRMKELTLELERVKPKPISFSLPQSLSRESRH